VEIGKVEFEPQSNRELQLLRGNLQRAIDRWRQRATVVEGNMTYVNHAWQVCAEELEDLLEGKTVPRSERLS
jgi:hypothetical protein